MREWINEWINENVFFFHFYSTHFYSFLHFMECRWSAFNIFLVSFFLSTTKATSTNLAFSLTTAYVKQLKPFLFIVWLRVCSAKLLISGSNTPTWALLVKWWLVAKRSSIRIDSSFRMDFAMASCKQVSPHESLFRGLHPFLFGF